MNLQTVSDAIEITKDFPKDGVNFRDISPLMMDPKLDSFVIDEMIKLLEGIEFDYFAGLDARGFLFKTIATKMNKGFIMIRKGDKLPNCISTTYGTEYSQDKICIANTFPRNKKIILLDDVLVTGGTFCAAINLIENIGSTVVACLTLIELVGCTRKEQLSNYRTISLLKYDVNSTSKELDPLLNKSNSNLFIMEEVHTGDITISTIDGNLNFRLIPALNKYSLNKKVEHECKEYIPLEPCEELIQVVVFSHPSMDSIAEGLLANSGPYRKGGIRWDKFPDGTPNITFENEKYLNDKRVIFLMSLSDGDLLDQISMIKVLPRQGIKSLDVYLPFFHVGTMERVNEFGPNQLATADTLSTMLSTGIAHTKEGPVRLHIYDLHTLHNRFYFGNDISIRMETGINLLKKEIDNDTIIIFPDDGAAKRFGGFFEGFNTLTCAKKRDGKKRKVVIEDFDSLPLRAKREHAIIVDDLVQTGGTLEECRKALVEKGFSKISAYVTHVVFPNDSHLRFIKKEEGFHKFYHTNSNPSVSIKLNCEPFHLLKLEDDISPSQFTDKFKSLIIYVASTSEIKLDAVYRAFSRKRALSRRYTCKIYGIDIKSNVSEQPIGEETRLGCNNRMNGLKSYVGDKPYDFLISMENGIYEEDDKTYDKCIIGIFKKDKGVSFVESDKVYFPTSYMEESKATGIFVGSLLKRDFGYNSKSWHHHFNKCTRKELIESALIRANHSDIRIGY